MADNLDDIQDGLRDVSLTMQEFLERLRRNVAISENELRNFARTTGVAEDRLRSMADAAKNARDFGNSLVGLTGSLGRGKSNFAVLNSTIEATANVLGTLMSAIPLVGSALNAGAQAVGKASSFMVEQFDTAYGSFESLSRSGLIGAEGIDHMTEGFDRLAVPLEVYQRLLEGNSRRLAQLSGSAFAAADSITSAAGDIKKSGLDMQLRTLGYSSEEIADTMIQYADIQRRIGNTQYMNQERLKRGTIEYAKELDAIAKLTGMSRKQLKEQTDAAMRNARFQAKIRQLEASGQGEAAQRLVKLNMALANYPELQKGFQDATTGFVNSPEARKAFLTTGGRLGAIIEDSVRGAELGDSLQGLSDATKSTMATQESLALASGDAPGVFIPLYESTGLATANLGDLATAVKTNYDTMSDASTNFRENTENLAKAKVNLESASSGITKLALSADFAASGVEKLSGAINDIVQWVKEQLLNTPSSTTAPSASMGSLQEAQDIASAKMDEYGDLADLNKTLQEQIDSGKFVGEELAKAREQLSLNNEKLRNLAETIKEANFAADPLNVGGYTPTITAAGLPTTQDQAATQALLDQISNNTYSTAEILKSDPKWDMSLHSPIQNESRARKLLLDGTFQPPVKEKPRTEAPSTAPVDDAITGVADKLGEIKALTVEDIEIKAPSTAPVDDAIKGVADKLGEIKAPSTAPVDDAITGVADKLGEIKAPSTAPVDDAIKGVADKLGEIKAPSTAPVDDAIKGVADKLGEIKAPTVAPKDIESIAKTIKLGVIESQTSAKEPVTANNTASSSLTNIQPTQGYKHGGVATGPKSGYQATLHGTEAVIPLEGKTIPIEIKDTRDMRPQLEIMEKQITRLDAMIAAIEKNTGINEKILRANSN